MTDDKLKGALLGLSASSIAARMRAVLPVIEAKRAEGVTHDAILDALRGAGLDASKSVYLATLARLRREAKKTNRSTPQIRHTTKKPTAPDPEPVGRTPAEPLAGWEPDGTTKAERERKAKQYIPDTPRNPLLNKFHANKKEQDT